MQRKLITYKYLLAALLLWAFSVSSAVASSSTPLPSAWNETPTLSEDVYPTYDFQTTSAYVANETATVSSVNGIRVGQRRNTNPWESGPGEDDLPTGVVPDPAPVGSPFILLILAFLYLLTKIAFRFSQKSRL
jgi:hypothetical protein